MESATTPQHQPAVPVPPVAAAKVKRSFPKAISAGLLLIGLALLKLKGLAIVLIEKIRLLLVNPFEGFGAIQFAVAGVSIVATVGAYAMTKYPLGLVIGFVLITLVHEIGHAVVIRAKGLRAGYMVFIPFVGGAVTMKGQARTAYDDAQIGLAGPIAGTFASLVALQIFKWTDHPLYLLIALAGFVLNLFNLLPIGPLDGGRVSAAVTKWMWVIGGGILTYKAISRPNALLILVLVLSLFQVYASILREKKEDKYYEVTGAQRAAIAIAYFSLVIFLGHQTFTVFERVAALAK
ncbi:MAG: metalloprotease [Thermoanaerobaculia bacterium]